VEEHFFNALALLVVWLEGHLARKNNLALSVPNRDVISVLRLRSRFGRIGKHLGLGLTNERLILGLSLLDLMHKSFLHIFLPNKLLPRIVSYF